MANINQQWRKFVAVGCYHSTFACKMASDAVIGFVDRYKPDTRIDLGDVHDFTAFRGGAKGTKDEAADITSDYKAGHEWLKRYRPTHRCHGNHDHRIYKLIGHQNAIISHAAGSVAESIREVDEENGTIVKPYKRRGVWFKFGDTLFGHGFMYNQMAIRDHAEHFGKSVIAHLHTPGMMHGRRLDNPVCWCVGTLARTDLLEYADTHRQTDCWAHAIAFGEYSPKYCEVILIEQLCGHGGAEAWRLPL
jgi:hypothetical protein